MSLRGFFVRAVIGLTCAVLQTIAIALAAPVGAASASSSQPGFVAGAAVDQDRFSTTSTWKGATNFTSWWWQVQFDAPRDVGAILQISGDHAFVFRHAPRDYVWQRSDDGEKWLPMPETAMTNEQRVFRILRLKESVKTRYLRLAIGAAADGAPALREVEVYSDPSAPIAFPDWIVAVNSTHDSKLPNEGQQFIPLAKSCAGSGEIGAQQVWVNEFRPELLAVEPRPLCAFLSGSFKDWCEVDRQTWRGAERVLKARDLPIWASCGGAQALAILAEHGADQPWDCPHCRDPKNPKTPIYGHIGHTAQKPCGDYSGCVFERGPHSIRAVTDDAVFRGLPSEFKLMESHCGQIEWAPAGWKLIATAGQGTTTKTQCLRMDDRPIYAAQFHIELDGAPVASKQIMSNFLAVAREWRDRRK